MHLKSKLTIALERAATQKLKKNGQQHFRHFTQKLVDGGMPPKREVYQIPELNAKSGQHSLRDVPDNQLPK